MKTIEKNKIIGNTKYLSMHEFETGHKVPIYLVEDIHDLNQVIGYVKFINKESGDIYYRGQNKLYNTMQPSLYHLDDSGLSNPKKVMELNSLIKRIKNDTKLMKELNLDSSNPDCDIIIESVLQHYGVPTRCNDVVDNHWIALWFGAYKFENKILDKCIYATYHKRGVNYLGTDEEIHQYLIMIGGSKSDNLNGVSHQGKIVTVDLRKTLPSTFLRPHSQHGIIIKNDVPKECCDLAARVVCILKIRIDKAQSWIGDGKLVSYENLFPSEFHDRLYRILLNRNDIFVKCPFVPIKYIYE